MRHRGKRPARRRAGISLAEVVVSIPLVGLVMVGAMNATGSVLRTWSQARESYQGHSLGEQLMAEVLQQAYEDPDDPPTFGVETGEPVAVRTAWDDVDDYYNLSQSPPRTRAGAAISGYTGWTQQCSVVYATLADPTQASATDAGLKRITVTVTDPAGRATVLTAYRSRWGAGEQPPAVDTTVQGYVSHDLTAGGGTLRGGASLFNHAE
ncbi:hypothetical protein [Posidoniimonas polymericola]|nr:hypothetical protein [Posidoniimonas polymericola]